MGNQTKQNTNNEFLSGRRITIMLFLFASFFFLFSGGKNDTAIVFRWLIAAFLIAFLCRPILALKRLDLIDGGFTLSLCLGFGISFLVSWILSAVGLPYNTFICIAGLVLVGGVATIWSTVRRNNISINRTGEFMWTPELFEKFLVGFALFTLAFSLFYYAKGYRPYIYSGTEQYMDYGIMMSIFRGQEIPPDDMWFAGSQINYYYLGLAAMTWFTRVAFTTPEFGYNLSIIMLATVVLVGVFTIVDAWLNVYFHEHSVRNKLCAALGAAFTAFAGNGHWFFIGLCQPILNALRGEASSSYWFPGGCSYIGSVDTDPDKGKNEFPAYSYVLGDLHAHYVNLMFILPLIVLLLDYAAYKNEDDRPLVEGDSFLKGIFKKEIFTPYVILIGLLTGLYRGSNYWDFPIYFVVAGAIILFCDLKKYGCKVSVFVEVLMKGAAILLIGTLVMLPFSLQFEKISSEICVAKNHSPLDKMAVLWAVQIVITLILLIYICATRSKKPDKKFNTLDLTMIAIALCAIGLVVVPEVIYVKDIYGDTYARYNTMFKLTYEAFLLMGILAGITVGLLRKGKAFAKAVGAFIAVIVLANSTYIINGLNCWFGKSLLKPDTRIGLSAVEYITNDADFTVERSAMQVLLDDKSKRINIIEASGYSYSDSCRLSCFTGSNTIVGWHTHEWLWRNDCNLVDERFEEVRKFYEDNDLEYCRQMLKKYDVDYIYVGPKEYQKYPSIDSTFFMNFGHTVWTNVTSNGELCSLIKVD